jgi:hypothetical protein
LLILVAGLAVSASEVQVSTLDGATISGKIQQITSDQIVVKTARGEESVQLASVLSVNAQKRPLANPAATAPTAWIELVDGSKLAASSFASSGTTATVADESGEQFDLPTSTIARVRFSSPDDPKSAWPAEAISQVAGDLLVARTKEGVDFLEGVLGAVTLDMVEFKFQGETLHVKRPKVDGLVYFHKAGDKLAAARCVVEGDHGLRLLAKYVALTDGQLEIAAVSGPTFIRPWNSITRLDFSAGKVVYLSDLEPESVRWTDYYDLGSSAPAVAQFYAPRRDQGREHGPIRLAGKTYAKGLALVSRTAIEYRLPAGLRTLKATAGIDDTLRQNGSVRLEISADRKSLFDGTISGKDPPVEVDLDIAGAKRLSILVDYGDNASAGDYLNLGDARMLK